MFANLIHLAHIGTELHAYFCELTEKKLEIFRGSNFLLTL